MIEFEEKKAVLQLERFINFIRLLKTLTYVQRSLCKHKPATLVVSIEEREKSKTIIFKLPHQGQLREEMKLLKPEKEVPKGS